MKNRPLPIRQPATPIERHWFRWPALRPFALLLAVLIAPLVGSARAASYVFTNIADSNGIFAPSGSQTTIRIGSMETGPGYDLFCSTLGSTLHLVCTGINRWVALRHVGTWFWT